MQPDLVLAPEQLRELTIDTMANWALDGLYPTRETVESIDDFLASGLTTSQYIEKLKGKWRRAEGGQSFVDPIVARLGGLERICCDQACVVSAT